MSPVIAILPYESRHSPNLSEVPLDGLAFPLGREEHADLKTVRDLGESDHLIVTCCSTAFRRSHKDIRCKVSLMIREPRAVQRRYYFLVLLMAQKFFRVLTYDRTLLRYLRNAVFALPADSWVAAKADWRKTRRMSVIASKKTDLPGHKLRHEAIRFAKDTHIDLDAFGHAYRFVEKKEEALSEYEFSLAIENSRQPNYFTEKIIDCFLQKVIPIYWGAPNIGDFFDKDGVVVCSTFEEIKQALVAVDHAFYEKHKAAVEANFQIAKNYADWGVNTATALLGSMSECHD